MKSKLVPIVIILISNIFMFMTLNRLALLNTSVDTSAIGLSINNFFITLFGYLIYSKIKSKN